MRVVFVRNVSCAFSQFHSPSDLRQSRVRRTLLSLIVLLGTGIFEASPVRAEEARPIIVFEKNSSGAVPYRLLSQELVRQGLLLTAREDFGAITRDEYLNETSSLKDRKVHRVTGDFQFARDPELKFTLTYTTPGASIPSLEFLFPRENNRYFEGILSKAHQLTLHEYPDYLKSLGMTAPDRSQFKEVDVGNFVETLPPLEFVSIFHRLRKLHAALLREPDRVDLLSSIAIHYALLSSVCEIHWGPEARIYSARALLYSDRACDRAADDIKAAWARALVRTFTGLDWLALKELERIESLQAVADPASRPDWADTIIAAVHWDNGQLNKLAEDDVPLAAYLRVLHWEYTSHSYEFVTPMVTSLMVKSPECLRVASILGNGSQLGMRRRVGESQFETFLSEFPEWVKEIDPLPKTVLTAADKAIKAKSERSKMAATVKLHDALRQVPLQEDGAEPSLASVATLAENLQFQFITGLLETDTAYLGVEPGDVIERVTPLLKKYPAKDYIYSYRHDPTFSHAALEKTIDSVIALPPPEESRKMSRHWRSHSPEACEKLRKAVLSLRDSTVRDVIFHMQVSTTDEYRQKLLDGLLQVSPYTPIGRSFEVKYRWDKVKDKAPEWLETTDFPALLESIGEKYSEESLLSPESAAMAEKAYKRLIEIAPSYDAYEQIEKFYAMHGRIEDALQARIASLQVPSYGLESAGVNQRVAEHYLLEDKPELARPYAMEAAESYSHWGLEIGIATLEALGENALAERLTVGMVQRYGPWEDWYLHCVRTGEGNIDAARTLFTQQLQQMDASQLATDLRVASFYELEGNLDMALSTRITHCKEVPNWITGKFLTAYLLYETGNREEARPYLVELINVDSGECYSWLAEQLLRAEREDAAFSPEFLEFVWLSHLENRATSKASSAIACALEMVDEAEQALEWYERGAHFGVEGKFTRAKAIQKLRDAGIKIPPVRRFPIPVEIRETMAASWNLHTLWNTPKAWQIQASDEIVRRAGHYPSVLLLQAHVNHFYKERDRAIDYYTRVLEKFPEHPFVLCYRAAAYEGKGDYAAAVADYHAAMKQAPDLLIAENNLGWLRIMCPDEKFVDPKEALERALKVRQASESMKSAHELYEASTLLAIMAYEKLGQTDEAEKLIKAASKENFFVSPNTKEAYESILKKERPKRWPDGRDYATMITKG
ncbi:hypothetical protein SH661x_003239 [Planctomicrobium sp. SH661]|uniref:tetratricopeptide repeat protein n=1 Tax=Planctomicrobium sp. SH661 TaxID=3448124 RepID=UPI003F5C6908